MDEVTNLIIDLSQSSSFYYPVPEIIDEDPSSVQMLFEQSNNINV